MIHGRSPAVMVAWNGLRSRPAAARPLGGSRVVCGRALAGAPSLKAGACGGAGWLVGPRFLCRGQGRAGLLAPFGCRLAAK